MKYFWRNCTHGLLLAALLLPPVVHAQSAESAAVAGSFKEVQIAGDAFVIDPRVPAWVKPVTVPETSKTNPVVFRLADTQLMVGAQPAAYVRRDIKINDEAALTEVGQIPVNFVPQYQKMRLHAVRILRGQEVLDRTQSSNVRFLQRERNLEQGVYSGEITASILVNDVRVGDTLEYLYTLEGENPVFGGKYFDQVSWDQRAPVELRHVAMSYPKARKI